MRGGLGDEAVMVDWMGTRLREEQPSLEKIEYALHGRQVRRVCRGGVMRMLRAWK